ncbi:MAG: CoA-binding protein, partial [Opitutae bacterium]|nr:CoA-binding protein [Opitutae bacterium]
IIVENILAQGFAPENVTILREGAPDQSGVRCVPDLAALPHKLDLLVVAVGAAQVPDLVEEIISRDAAHAVMLIPGGMGETEDSRERAAQVVARINQAHGEGDGGPIFLGANCMGVVSRPGRYDTWFIPEEKLPRDRGKPYRRAALVSQSGAFMLHRSSQCPELVPAYMISMGNQTDLTLGDMVSYFKDSDQVDVIAVYAEGFSDLDGLAFCRAVREAVMAGKEVVFYKAGRTPEGKSATSGHTASLAGDFMVCESCVRQAGAIVAQNFNQFQDLFLLAETLNAKKIRGNRLAAVSGAGFEAVGMADSIQSDDYSMQLAPFAPESVEKIAGVLREKRLDALVSIVNPLDINPAADDDAHA